MLHAYCVAGVKNQNGVDVLAIGFPLVLELEA